MFELFGLTEGTFEVRTRGWALLQVVSGFLSLIVGLLQLIVWTSEVILKTNPFITYENVTINCSTACVSFMPMLHLPTFEVDFTPVVPKSEAVMNVFLGGGFLLMGLLLLLAVDQKSVRKCTIWLAATTPMFILITSDGLSTFCMEPSVAQLTKLPLWAAFCYSALVVINFRLQLIQFHAQRSGKTAYDDDNDDNYDDDDNDDYYDDNDDYYDDNDSDNDDDNDSKEL